MRNPVDRAYSLYNWMVMEGYETSTTFEQALEREDRRSINKKVNYNQLYFGSGMYFAQVQRYLKLFGPNVSIIQYEQLVANPFYYISKTFAELGLPPISVFPFQCNVSRRVYHPWLQFAIRQLIRGNCIAPLAVL